MIARTIRVLMGLLLVVGGASPVAAGQEPAALSSERAGAVSAGGSHTCILTTSGRVKCWGDNYYGELGDGTTTERAFPVDVLLPAGSVAAVQAGWVHTCALTTGGGVKCWGTNGYGQLGTGTTTKSSVPVDVVGLSNGVTSVSAGSNHTCALTMGGGVKCWGDNQHGQLGDGTSGTFAFRTTPVDVVGLASGVIAISAGSFHTCAVTASGEVKCWGLNEYGQLGDGTSGYGNLRTTPVDVAGLSSGMASISAGGLHTCGLTASSGIKCWGANYGGQLGDGTTTYHSLPVDVVGLSVDMAVVDAGYSHTCALTVGGGVKCWGQNSYGQLGDGASNTIRPTPADVSGLSSGVVTISAGVDHSCAVTTGGRVRCWGVNLYSQLGDGTSRYVRPTPVDTMGLSTLATTVEAGFDHNCALVTGGGIQCWGRNDFGQLGDGTATHSWIAVDVEGLASVATTACTGGEFHSCALAANGGVRCWGRNDYGQLGDGTWMDHSTPEDVGGLGPGVAAIAAGASHTCAVTAAGGARCWGGNWNGQLGDGTSGYSNHRPAPVDVVGLSSGVAAVSAGASHTCVLTTGGGVKCWGYNLYGQLGDGTTTDQSTPVDVVGLSSGIVAISVGGWHTCALTTAGGVKCWGANPSGQLGDGRWVNSTIPVDVVGLVNGVAAVSAGMRHTCVLTTEGRAKCWGANESGQVGDGTTINSGLPVDVAGLLSDVVAVSAGLDHTCALTTGTGARCWGQNDFGQLGVNPGWIPVDVVGLEGNVYTGVRHFPYVAVR